MGCRKVLSYLSVPSSEVIIVETMTTHLPHHNFQQVLFAQMLKIGPSPDCEFGFTSYPRCVSQRYEVESKLESALEEGKMRSASESKVGEKKGVALAIRQS